MNNISHAIHFLLNVRYCDICFKMKFAWHCNLSKYFCTVTEFLFSSKQAEFFQSLQTECHFVLISMLHLNTAS